MEVIEGFNPFDTDEGPHHFEKMAELRARCPVARLESGMMILSRFDDVNFVNNTLHSLAQNPDVFERIRADRTLVPNVVEKSLLRDSPSMFLSRLCAADKTIVDEPAAKGQKVLLGRASSADDEARREAGSAGLDRASPDDSLRSTWEEP
jgi:cytochrome P450